MTDPSPVNSPALLILLYELGNAQQAVERQKKVVNEAKEKWESRSTELNLQEHQQTYDTLKSKLSEIRMEAGALKEEKRILLLQKQLHERIKV